MERTEVVSSNIASVGYDEKARVLEVEFANGGIYQYHGVPKSLHQQLIGEKSVGAFFSKRIRNVFRCERVEE